MLGMWHFWAIFVPLISAGVFMLPHCVQLLEFCFKSVQFLPLNEYFSERNINRRNVFPYLIMLRKHKCSEYNHNYFADSILRAMTHIFLYIDPTDHTPSILEIIWVKNVRAIVVCGFLMKSLKKHILKV